MKKRGHIREWSHLSSVELKGIYNELLSYIAVFWGALMWIKEMVQDHLSTEVVPELFLQCQPDVLAWNFSVNVLHR